MAAVMLQPTMTTTTGPASLRVAASASSPLPRQTTLSSSLRTPSLSVASTSQTRASATAPSSSARPKSRTAAAATADLLSSDELVTEKTIEQAEQEMSSSEYNQRMKRAMANPYEYHHHLGMYYTRILPKLIVGSQPQNVDDVSRLHHEEGVDVILNLQQDHDMAYWGIDLHPIKERCDHHGVRHYRRPAVDFDPHSLRNFLPRMVAVIEHNVSEGRTVYVHCTAGLGRAPASAIAYLFWFHDMDLKKAYDFLTSKRPCGPKWDAIRGATYDLALDCPHKIPLEHLPECAFSDVSQFERDLIQLRCRQLYHH